MLEWAPHTRTHLLIRVEGHIQTHRDLYGYSQVETHTERNRHTQTCTCEYRHTDKRTQTHWLIQTCRDTSTPVDRQVLVRWICPIAHILAPISLGT